MLFSMNLSVNSREYFLQVFFLWFCISVACIPHIERGLDQELSMPEDSYVIDYFLVSWDF